MKTVGSTFGANIPTGMSNLHCHFKVKLCLLLLLGCEIPKDKYAIFRFHLRLHIMFDHLGHTFYSVIFYVAVKTVEALPGERNTRVGVS